MQISLEWVNELINVKFVDLDYLIEKLTLGGFEVEEIIEVKINNKKIITLDISATANRSDSLSLQGISLEIAALLNKPPKTLKYSMKTFQWNEKIRNLSKTSLTENECSMFLGITVENLTNLRSPNWLKCKLLASGVTVENNLLDFENYILLETGYPFQFYDLDKINLKSNEKEKLNLTLSPAKNQQKFITNDEIEYKLNNSILVLKTKDLPIGIAGIAASNTVSYSKTTKALLIEGSIFNSAKIRQQCRTLGLRTERAGRYEKSIKSTNLIKSCYRLISLLRIANPFLTCKLSTIAQSLQKELSPVFLNYSTVNKILGPIVKLEKVHDNYISIQTITNCLERLNFSYTYDKINLIWKVIIPELRSDDIVQEIDLIEEIGRLFGFNNFLAQLPRIKKMGTEDSSYQTRKKLTSCLLNLGLNELIHYSLVDRETYLDNKIGLINPLLKDCSYLRSSLLPNLIQTVQKNSKKNNNVIEGFEYGHVFLGNDLKEFKEKEYVAGIFGSMSLKSLWSEVFESLNWFEAKGKIEQLFKRLNILIYWKAPISTINKNIFHPYCTGEIYLTDGTLLGVFGQIHPILSKKLNISQNLYLFEFNFTLIKNQIQTSKLAIYQEYSIYPKVIKDLSFIIHNDTSFDRLKQILYFNSSKFLTEINLLDEYKGQSIPENHTSLCLQFVFQSPERTLQTREIENIVKNIQFLLTNKFNATLRT